jgi:hypothetical protein
MNAFTWAWHRWFGVAALAVASGTAGWALGRQGHDGRDPAPAHMVHAYVATVLRAPAAGGPGAAIQSFADGTISVHVDHVAVGWLLLELGSRGAVPDAAGPDATDGTVVVSESSCEPAEEDGGVVDTEFLERTLAEGTESERQAALTQALQAGIELEPEVLRQTYGSDPSESVRLLAFTTYVDTVSDDRAEVRAALQSGASNGSPAVQAEAQRPLAELEQYERAPAETPPQGLP